MKPFTILRLVIQDFLRVSGSAEGFGGLTLWHKASFAERLPRLIPYRGEKSYTASFDLGGPHFPSADGSSGVARSAAVNRHRTQVLYVTQRLRPIAYLS